MCWPGSAITQRQAGKPRIAQGFGHALTAGAITRGVDIRFRHATGIGSGAEKVTEMTFLVAPCCDLDGAICARIRVDDTRGFECIDDTKRAIEPAGVTLAFEMRAGQQLRSGSLAGSDDVADAIDRAGQPRLGKTIDKPMQ
jgi:hypothetical protein